MEQRSPTHIFSWIQEGNNILGTFTYLSQNHIINTYDNTKLKIQDINIILYIIYY